MKKIALGDYILRRLKKFNVDHIFGVPGDYNLEFLDQILNSNLFEWIGNCNELNAAYAADGYSRVKGMSALVTTFGVGELSALNGIAGAYAENVPIIAITGAPALSTQKKHSIVHHNLGDGKFNHFLTMFKEVTAAQLYVTRQTKASEIDKIFYAAWFHKKPVYILLPSDVANIQIPAPTKPIHLMFPRSNTKIISKISIEISTRLLKAKKPLVVIGFRAADNQMQEHIISFLSATGLPFITLNLAKGIIDESHPQFLGHYIDPTTSPLLYERIKHSDCVIGFELLLSDLNIGCSGDFITANDSIEIHRTYFTLQKKVYKNIFFIDLIPAIINELKNYRYQDPIDNPKTMPHFHPTSALLTQDRLWQCMSHVFTKNSILIGEVGTSAFGCLNLPVYQNTLCVLQLLWASIGFTVGALLGTCLADRKRRSILFVGDGSFQCTVQEISTIVRHQLNPIIFLINNGGYTIERLIHRSNLGYNDIQEWKYGDIVKNFGGSKTITTIVQTEQELNDILNKCIIDNEHLYFIEIITKSNDAVAAVKHMGNSLAKANQY